MKQRSGLMICIAFLTAQLFASDPVFVTPEKAGFSSERLQKIGPVMQSYIDEGKLSGITTLIARNGKIVQFDTFGWKDIESKTPMAKDNIFRIYSMSKPVTAVAAMILYEEGRFQLEDPVSKYIPEFKDLKVCIGGTVQDPLLVDPEREMTIHDLFRHTTGFTYDGGTSPVDSLYQIKKVQDKQVCLHEMIVKLGQIPLRYQPGTTYHYGVSIDVLGYLVEVLSGTTLDQFMRERIFEPLEMHDTGFFVPREKLDRFVTLYQKTETGTLTVGDHPQFSNYRTLPAGCGGGGGLVSTPLDYLRFAQMILNKGELDGKRILSPQTVDFMLRNHLPEGEQVNPGEGYGLGFGVTMDPVKNGILCSKGEASWSGAANTFFWIDPSRQLIYMTWTNFFPWGLYDFRYQFRVMVHSALME